MMMSIHFQVSLQNALNKMVLKKMYVQVNFY